MFSLINQNSKIRGTRFNEPSAFSLIFFLVGTLIIDKLVKDDDIVIFCSALSNPNFVYKNKNHAYEFNVNKTINFIKKIKSKINRLIFLSSVEVFDGLKGNYDEKDNKNPLNFYGKTKVEVENFILDNLENSTIIRTGWNSSMKFEDRCVIKLTYETLLKANAKIGAKK